MLEDALSPGGSGAAPTIVTSISIYPSLTRSISWQGWQGAVVSDTEDAVGLERSLVIQIGDAAWIEDENRVVFAVRQDGDQPARVLGVKVIPMVGLPKKRTMQTDIADSEADTISAALRLLQQELLAGRVPDDIRDIAANEFGDVASPTKVDALCERLNMGLVKCLKPDGR